MRHEVIDGLPCQERSISLNCETALTSRTYRVPDQYQRNLNHLHPLTCLQLKKAQTTAHLVQSLNWSPCTGNARYYLRRGVHYTFGIHLVSLKFLHKYLRYEQDNGRCVLDGLLNEPQINGTSATMGWTWARKWLLSLATIQPSSSTIQPDNWLAQSTELQEHTGSKHPLCFHTGTTAQSQARLDQIW
jgi:hypothetical protein